MWGFFAEMSCTQQILGAVIALMLGVWAWLKLTTGKCTSRKRLDGKTVLITGANTGIGKETALDLARRGARVILACRNEDKALAVKSEIIAKTGNSDVQVMQVELANLKSVRNLAKKVLASESRLDVLVLNAGCAGMSTKVLSEDGLEQQMASNHFGHFLLVNLLLGLLKKSQPSRIVVVSSILHKMCTKLDLDNLNSEKNYSPAMIYNTSKLCNILMTQYLAKKLQGSGVTINALHPGVVTTDIIRNVPLWMKFAFYSLPQQFCKTAEQGAQTSIYLSVSEEVEDVSGKYFVDCKVAEETTQARDAVLAEALWVKSERLVQLQPGERNF